MASLPLCEMARRYVAKVPGSVSGQGGHNQTFSVACALVKGFDLSIDEARSLLGEYNQRCEPPWSPAELEHKLRQADGVPDERARGWLLVQDPPEGRSRGTPVAPPMVPESGPARFAEDKLGAFASRWRGFVNTAWLADRSPIEPYGLSSDAFLRALFREGERVIVFTDQKTQGQGIWPRDAIPSGSPGGVWFLCQPVDGRDHPNPRSLDAGGKPKLSRRSAEAVTAWRYLVLESDAADARDWMGALVQLPLRIAAVYTSGKRSIHALVMMDSPSMHEWNNVVKRMRPVLVTLGADPKAMSAVRLTRLPGCLRGGKLQKLLYLHPEPGTDPICTLPRRRDVLAGCSSWIEGLLKFSPEEVRQQDPESIDACDRALEWYGSAPAVAALLDRVRSWKEAAR